MTVATLTAPEPNYLIGLNPPQREAVLSVDGPVLMLAGAGTGKTRALTARLTHVLSTGRAYPGQILAVTFTNKAAREMQYRVGQLIGSAVEGMQWLGTFHSVAARMLRRHAELVGLKSNFTILDTDDQIRLLKQVLTLADVDDKRWPARVLAGLIDRFKNRGWWPNQVPSDELTGFADGKLLDLYTVYQQRLLAVNACDFGDLLMHCLTLFSTHHDVLADYHRRFKYILVDEYQDTNVAQYLWLRLLAQARSNICCVGDDDQSIYGWRGAEIGNILRFEQDFPGAKVIRLEQNYRSTEHILGAASGLISANRGRLGKTLWTDAHGGEKVRVVSLWDGPEEARWVGDHIESLQVKGHKLAHMAVLVRATFQTREFEDRFITLGVSYRIIGGFRFYERAEVRDALAYLRLIAQPADDLAFERIINTPKRGIGDKALKTLHGFARAQNMPLFSAARTIVATDEIAGAARRALFALVQDFDRWRGQVDALPHTEIAKLALEDSGYIAMLQADKSPEAAGRLENLQELLRAMDEFDSLGAFLEHVSLVMDNDAREGDDKITVMTMHAAKGLEFDTVFLAGWEEGVFPSQRALDEGGLASLEEERRLAYVGITRARRQAIILHAANRRIYGQWQSAVPSRFIEELPREHIETETTMSQGATMWRYASGLEDPFADVARGSGRGPGWARAQAAGGLSRTSPPLIEAKATRLNAPESRQSAFRQGQKVFHDKFGPGVVVRVDGAKLEIAFEKSGLKHVVDSFVRAA
jgi:DNA helicase II / ATP-dependent DNA helicase PcrA